MKNKFARAKRKLRRAERRAAEALKAPRPPRWSSPEPRLAERRGFSNPGDADAAAGPAPSPIDGKFLVSALMGPALQWAGAHVLASAIIKAVKESRKVTITIDPEGPGGVTLRSEVEDEKGVEP